MAAALADQRDVLEEVIEPYLMQQSFVQRTPRGRTLTAKGYGTLGPTPPIDPAPMLQQQTPKRATGSQQRGRLVICGSG